MPPLIEVEDRRLGDKEEVGNVSTCTFKTAAKIKSLPLTNIGKMYEFLQICNMASHQLCIYYIVLNPINR